MSDRPASALWQRNVPPHPSNGGWSCIMRCLCYMRGADEGHASQTMAELIAKHGEPSRAFAAAWLKDFDELYSRFAAKEPSEYHEWWCWAIEGVRSLLAIPRGADIPFTQPEINSAIDAWFASLAANPPTSNTFPPHSERI